MVEVWLPYSDTEVVARVPDENFLGVVDGRDMEGVDDSHREIVEALDSPRGGKRLEDSVKPGLKVAIVVDDKTRPAPNRLMLPPLLEKLNRLGVDDEAITLIIGCGAHSMRLEDAPSVVGAEVHRRVSTVVHDCHAPDLVDIGRTSYKNDIFVNSAFAEADMRILTGDVELHYYAGYGGGRKSVLPAICGFESIQRNHRLLLHRRARTGILDGNPVHLDMVEAVRLAEVDFTLNVVLNAKRELVKAVAGDVEEVFMEGVNLVDALYKIPVTEKADIVLVSPGGYPADIDLYQAYKGIDSALNVVKDGGVIILAAECPEGHGNATFHDWMVRFKDRRSVERELRRRFVFGGHKAYYLMKALERVQIILVSTLPDYTSRMFRLQSEKTLNKAVKTALGTVGKKAKVLAIPHATTTLPLLRKP
jgi:nickel-dependent lactate racemase